MKFGRERALRGQVHGISGHVI